MRTNRRKFIGGALAGGIAATLPGSCVGSESRRTAYARLDDILKKPVLKKELFARPVIIKSLELLRYDRSFLCRVRSSDGAEGVSVGGLIILKNGLTAAEELSVLAHETAHEILHANKDNRPKDKKVRETEAEAVAFVVCHAIGLDTNSAISDYIQLYNGDKETLIDSLGRIQKTASEILEAVMDKESEGETADRESSVAVAA